jgi:predicted metal-dependent phosphoesterase TrpH
MVAAADGEVVRSLREEGERIDVQVQAEERAWQDVGGRARAIEPQDQRLARLERIRRALDHATTGHSWGGYPQGDPPRASGTAVLLRGKGR